MTPAEELLSRLRSLNVMVWADDDNLRYRAPKGTMTPALAAELKSLKVEILAALPSSGPFLERIPDQDHYEVSHAQRRLWVLSQMPEASVAYNIPLHQLFRGRIHRNCLQSAIARMVQRHEVLRTTFVSINGEPRQIVHPTINFEVGFRDFSEHPHAEVLLRDLGREESRTRFDLANGPLFRISLAKLGEQLHVLFFTIHHIIADGTSLSVLRREFVRLYDAARKDISDEPPPLRIQYRDYAAWQNRYLTSTAAAVHRQYWHQKLTGPIPVLNLPTDYPRPIVRAGNGRELSFSLDKAKLDALLKYSRRHSVSLFMTLVAGVKVLLYKYTGQADLIVGSPIAGRVEAELEDQVGFYLNILPLRDRLQSDASFESLLQKVKRTATQAYDHQIYPFDRLVDELHVERDLSRSPVCDVIVVLQNQNEETVAIDDCEVLPFFEHPETSKVDLTFSFKETLNGLVMSIEYDTDLFLGSRIQRMGQHLFQLLDSILSKSGDAISRLKILPQTERDQLIGALDNMVDSGPGNRTFIELFEEQVERTPDDIAVRFSDATLSFRDLNAKSNQLARYLQSRGIGPEVPVGLFVERSLNLVVGLIGIMKAGGFYIPLDPGYPDERLELMVAHAKPPIIVTQESLRAKAPKGPAHVCIDTDSPAISRNNGENVVCCISPLNAAYAIYTSGSTGQPKGVQISHGSLANLLISTQQDPGLSANDVLLAVTTISFDIAGLEIYLPLVAGARLVIAPVETTSDGAALANAIQSLGITVMQGTPATWRLLLNSGWKGAANLKILCGGEALPGDLADALMARSAGMWNLYGPTETTIWSTANHVRRSNKDTSGDVSLGTPLRNTQLYVMDRSFELTPIGVPGELYIGGDGLARGYVGQPATTAEKFVPNPFRDGDRLYKTGDLVCYCADGQLRFLGRLDNQVKIRGFRIEPGEIEATLRRHPALRECVVTVRESAAEDMQLIAYVVTNEQPPFDVSDVRSFLRQFVPHYMVPSGFIVLDALPLTPAGKVDRRRLLDSDLGTTQQPYVEARNDSERTIAVVWQNVLNIARIGVHDNFFEMGGNSLKAAKATFMIANALGADITITDLFREPTVEALGRIAATKGRSQHLEIPRVEALRND